MSPATPDEELLHLLLDREEGGQARRAEALRRARNDPAAAAVLGRYDGVLARARALDRRAEWSPARERAFVKRVLGRTTREDLRWRGDARLVLQFVGQRLRSSPALRALAAGVVGCTLLSTMFAWMAIQGRPEPPVRIGFELPREGEAPARFDPPPSEEGEGRPATTAGGTDAVQRAWAVANAVRRERFLLARWAASTTLPERFPALGDDAPLTARLLAARTHWLADAAWPAWIDTEATLDAARGLDRSLLVELLLDRAVQTGAAPSLLPRALQRLARETAGGRAEDPVTELGRRALHRARGLGRWDAGGLPSARAMPRPLDADWRALLAAALPAELRDHPGIEVWLR